MHNDVPSYKRVRHFNINSYTFVTINNLFHFLDIPCENVAHISLAYFLGYLICSIVLYGTDFGKYISFAIELSQCYVVPTPATVIC